ncbi:hypothetical protein [Chitinophaga sp. 212800010-3]|uniref:hypothetical protein n=1 Tax=unclassified Chitinophaga TaxID=2619133 RepID=UPI002DEA7494|nr:DUF2335 domain-containing protein [Chitinophaga sp. 212800010-3]
MQAEIIQNYFASRPSQLRVADLEQLLLADGLTKEEAGKAAAAGFEQYFRKQLRTKGLKALLFFIVGLIFLLRVITLTNREEGSFMQVSLSLALVAFTIVLGIIWGVQLFALREEITSFRDIRKL